MPNTLKINIAKKPAVFGGEKLQSLPKEQRLKQAARIGAYTCVVFVLAETKMIGHFTDDERVLNLSIQTILIGLRLWVPVVPITFYEPRSVRWF